MNPARIKFFGMFICARCKMQTVSFEKPATAFETPAKTGSSLRRIQRFMAEYVPDCNLTARLIFRMLPHRPPYRLAMDRTNRKFGKTNINVLTLAVIYRGIAFPILISMLNKRGNSHTPERIGLINRYIALFGYETVDCLLADRELQTVISFSEPSECTKLRGRMSWEFLSVKMLTESESSNTDVSPGASLNAG